jgi:hypothetical protein
VTIPQALQQASQSPLSRTKIIMAEYKTDDKAQAEYIEHASRDEGSAQQIEQSRLDDAELMAGEATEKASFPPFFSRAGAYFSYVVS